MSCSDAEGNKPKHAVKKILTPSLLSLYILQQPRMEKLLELDGGGNAKCAHCGIAGAKYRCSCELEHYCGRECQKKQWANHQEACPVFLSKDVERAKLEHGSDSAELARCEMTAGFAVAEYREAQAEQYFLDAARIYTALVASCVPTAVEDDSPNVGDETKREGATGGEGGESPSCVDDLAMAYFCLGNLYCSGQGRLDEALELFQKSLEAINGKDTEFCKVTRVFDLLGIGFVLGEQDKNSEALEKYEEAYSISDEVHGPENGQAVCILDHISETHFKMGNKDRAIEIMEKVVNIERRALGDSLHLAERLAVTGKAILMSGRDLTTAGSDHPFASCDDPGKAHEMFKESMEIYVRVLGSANHEKVAECFSNLACCKGCQGENAEAIEFLREACRIYDHLGIHTDRSRFAAEALMFAEMIQLMAPMSLVVG